MTYNWTNALGILHVSIVNSTILICFGENQSVCHSLLPSEAEELASALQAAIADYWDSVEILRRNTLREKAQDLRHKIVGGKA